MSCISFFSAIYFHQLKNYLLVPTTLFSCFLAGILLSIYIKSIKILTLNFTVLMGLLLLLEAGFFLKARFFAQNANTGTYNYQYFIPDPNLGYKINPKNRIYTSIQKKGNNTIYDVTYHIDKNGFRITPRFKQNQDCIWFVGDSFTFGEGVNNSENLPWLWSKYKQVNTVNFGVHGYGPHQVLRLLETREKNNYTQKYCQPHVIFLQLLPEHVLRTSGAMSWDKNGPWYALDNHGNLYLKGKFSDKAHKTSNIYFQKSYLINYIESKITRPATTPSTHDWAVYKKIIAQINIESQKIHAKFIILLWDINATGDTPTYTKETKNILDSLNIDYLLASNILPADQIADYFITQDGHPTFKGYETIAKSDNSR